MVIYLISEGGHVLLVLCTSDQLLWNITKPLEKDWIPWVDVGIKNTYVYCDANNVEMELQLEDNTIQAFTLTQPVLAAKDVIVRYNTQGSVVDSISNISADFFNCHA